MFEGPEFNPGDQLQWQ